MGFFSKIFKPAESTSDKDEGTGITDKQKVREQNNNKDMSEKIRFTIDGKPCTADKGMNIVDAAAENGIFIPTLCHLKGVVPAGSCRICNVIINGRPMTACTTEASEGMVIQNNIPEIQEMRKIIVETLFVSGNLFARTRYHFFARGE